MSSLKVEVISASNVPNLETFGESDPYATITYQGRCVTINRQYFVYLIFNRYTCHVYLVSGFVK